MNAMHVSVGGKNYSRHAIVSGTLGNNNEKIMTFLACLRNALFVT